jgi:hypothetical protein
MREFRMSGSVEGAVGNRRPYSDPTTERTSPIDCGCKPTTWTPFTTACSSDGPVQHYSQVAVATYW